jgi:hypothetical protein
MARDRSGFFPGTTDFFRVGSLPMGTSRPQLLAAVLAAACASTPAVRPNAPDSLKPPDTETVALTVFAEGTQNYACREATPGGGFAWTLTGPEAVLHAGSDAMAPAAGTHYAGPTWQATDGSKFIGDASKAVKADAPDGASIPWLLVPKKSGDASGTFSRFSYVQRLNTSGGKAPASGCDAGHADQVVKIPYSATYCFYQPK